MDRLHSKSKDRLYEGMLKLKSVEEFYAFFEDVCTIKEIEEIAQRLEVAMMLHRGENYVKISKETGASTATISRVNKCLSYGSGGYKIVLDRLEKEE